jgi:hypothetical protein
MSKTEIMTDRKTGEQIEVRARDGKEVDEWDMLKALSREKRARRQAGAPYYLDIVRKAGYQPVLLGELAQHYRVNRLVDYWPTTGTWRTVDGKRKGRGVQSLIALLKEIRRAKD